MKNLFLSTIAALGFFAVSCGNDDESSSYTVIEAGELPQAARLFVETHFSTATYSRIEKQKVADSDGSIYDVHLSNGFEIDFDADGDWTDVDGNNQQVPSSIIPEPIMVYVASQYANTYVTTIEIENNGYEVELNNGIDLVFDSNGNFIRVGN
jgi:hypothetical protein